MDALDGFNRRNAVTDIGLYGASKCKAILLLQGFYGFRMAINNIDLFQFANSNPGKGPSCNQILSTNGTTIWNGLALYKLR